MIAMVLEMEEVVRETVLESGASSEVHTLVRASKNCFGAAPICLPSPCGRNTIRPPAPFVSSFPF